MKIINLTQHAATAEQIAAGVFEPRPDCKARIIELLNFSSIPTMEEIFLRAEELADLAQGADAAMIGGAPYLMAQLHQSLESADVLPLYAFSIRESVEETQPDGSVRKVNVFRHAGWVGMEDANQ